MSNALKTYSDLISPPARALQMFIKLNQIPHELYAISIGRGDHLTAEFEENINRFKSVPAIVDNDFKLSESVAIYRYLASEYNIEDHWYPKDSKKRACVDEFLEWQHLNTRIGCGLYTVYTWSMPIVSGMPAAEIQVTEAEKQMDKALNLVTSVWLKNNPFIVGYDITVADLVAASEIEQLIVTDYDPFKGRPKLKTWIELVKSKTSPHYEEAHRKLYKIAYRNKSKL